MQKRNTITITARLVIAREKAEALEEWIGHKLVTIQNRVVDKHILYAGTRDGYSNELFHKQCDGKSPTVVFVVLANKCVFGGYTSIPWSSDERPKADPHAFLFSLTDGGDRQACKLPQYQHKGYAVSHYKDRGPLFGVGGGSDLGLNLDESMLATCRSHVGISFELPRESPKEPLVSSTFLAGKLDHWDVEDVVVYHCSSNADETSPLLLFEQANTNSRASSKHSTSSRLSTPSVPSVPEEK